MLARWPWRTGLYRLDNDQCDAGSNGMKKPLTNLSRISVLASSSRSVPPSAGVDIRHQVSDRGPELETVGMAVVRTVSGARWMKGEGIGR